MKNLNDARLAGRGLSLCALALVLVGTLGACSRSGGSGGAASEASPAVVQANADMAKGLNLADQQDFEDAKRGFIAKPRAIATRCCWPPERLLG